MVKLGAAIAIITRAERLRGCVVACILRGPRKDDERGGSNPSIASLFLLTYSPTVAT